MLIPIEYMKNLIITDHDYPAIFEARIETCTKKEMKKLIELDDSYIDVYDCHIIANHDELKEAYDAL